MKPEDDLVAWVVVVMFAGYFGLALILLYAVLTDWGTRSRQPRKADRIKGAD